MKALFLLFYLYNHPRHDTPYTHPIDHFNEETLSKDQSMQL